MAEHQRAGGDPAFDWWMTGAHLWILGGLFLDGWHHINDPGLETFFTPWHGVLYSGVGIAMALVFNRALRSRRRGLSWRAAIPEGYRLSILGGAIFLGGAIGDMLWHELLGVEVGVEALLSPTHLTLAVAGVLVFTGPLRAAAAGNGSRWPALFSVAAVVALLGFFTQYVHPFTHLYPTLTGGGSADLRHAAGMAGIMLHAAVFTGAVLLPALRQPLPTGGVVLILGLPALLMATQRGTYVLLPALVLAAVVGEVLLRWRPPSRRAAGNLRLAAAVLPAAIFTGYFATLALAAELTWSVHLVTGGVALAAGAGTMVGVLLLAPDGVSEPGGPPDETAADALRSRAVAANLP